MSVSSANRPDGLPGPACAIALLAALLAAGCATPKSAELPDLSAWEVRNAVLGELRTWEFRGRIAVQSGGDGFNGKLRYSRDDGRFRATVSGPLGVGTVLIEGDDRRVLLTDKDGVRTVLPDAERDLRSRYGWTIPVASLRYWALGIPDPVAPAETSLNADGQLERLAQRDWAVRIPRYRDGGGQRMPASLTAESADTRVRLVIDHWIFVD